MGAGGKLPPGPQALKGLITPNTSGSGGPHKVKQQGLKILSAARSRTQS